jgi:hypothetical protein
LKPVSELKSSTRACRATWAPKKRSNLPSSGPAPGVRGPGLQLGLAAQPGPLAPHARGAAASLSSARRSVRALGAAHVRGCEIVAEPLAPHARGGVHEGCG